MPCMPGCMPGCMPTMPNMAGRPGSFKDEGNWKTAAWNTRHTRPAKIVFDKGMHGNKLSLEAECKTAAPSALISLELSHARRPRAHDFCCRRRRPWSEMQESDEQY